MVSPPDKNGGDVTANATRTHAAAAGGAAMFASLQGFSDVVGSGIAFEYMSKRIGPTPVAPNGWQTHAVTPPQESMTYAGAATNAEPYFERQFSDDLNLGVFRAWSPLTSDPMVADAYNLYVRDDLRSPGEGAFQLVTPCPDCSTPLPDLFKNSKPWFAGASADFEHVLFESVLKLTPEATANFFSAINLYEWHPGGLRAAGVLPDGSTAPRSLAGTGIANPAGSGPFYLSRAISEDGTRINFTQIPTNNAQEGVLYQRINGRTTIPLNLSERTSCAEDLGGAPPCIPAPDDPAPARYWDASSDGSSIIFTSVEALTDDAPDSMGTKAYMWRRAATNETQEVSVDASGGTFTLAFNGTATDAIPFGASSDVVEAALEDIITIKEGNVAVTGGPDAPGGPDPYEMPFIGDFAGANVAELTADDASLLGASQNLTVVTTSPAGNLVLLSVDEEPADNPDGPSVEGVIGASEDGEHVYFVSGNQLVSGEPELDSDEGLYHWHANQLDYVGLLANFNGDEASLMGSTTAVVNRKQSAIAANGDLLFPSTSGDGLLSTHDLPDYVHRDCRRTESSGIHPCQELYLYSAESGQLRCASCDPSGEAPNGIAAHTHDALTRVRANAGASATTAYLNRPLSADGRFVFFSTAAKLVDEDTNGRIDAYAYDSQSETPHLLSSGTHNSDAYFLDASADGTDAFIVTPEQLSGWDRDQGYDLYDARIGGGFPDPIDDGTTICGGDPCQGTSSVPPQRGHIGSASFSGPGNVRVSVKSCAASAQKAKHLNRKSRVLRRKARRIAGRGEHRTSRRVKRRARTAQKRAQRLKRVTRRCRRGREAEVR